MNDKIAFSLNQSIVKFWRAIHRQKWCIQLLWQKWLRRYHKNPPKRMIKLFLQRVKAIILIPRRWLKRKLAWFSLTHFAKKVDRVIHASILYSAVTYMVPSLPDVKEHVFGSIKNYSSQGIALSNWVSGVMGYTLNDMEKRGELVQFTQLEKDCSGQEGNDDILLTDDDDEEKDEKVPGGFPLQVEAPSVDKVAPLGWFDWLGFNGANNNKSLSLEEQEQKKDIPEIPSDEFLTPSESFHLIQKLNT